MPRPSVSQISRFCKKEAVQLLLLAKRTCRYPGLDIKSAPKIGDFGRILVITPAKSGSAPERNLIRRRLKAIFYEEKLYTSSFSWIIFIKRESQAYTFLQLKELLTACIQSKNI